MIDFGTQAEKRACKALLETHHRIDVIIQLMTLSHGYLSELSDMLLSGQVNIDSTADVTRSVTMDLRDPKHQLKLDDKAPQDGSLYFTKMVKVTFVISTPGFGTHYYIPIFCGPLSKVDRNGPIVSIEAQGKETLSSQTPWTARTYKPGWKKTSVITDILAATGETKFQFVDRASRLGKPGISAKRDKKFTFWLLAKKIAKGMNLQLFYDGRGIARLRKPPQKAVYEFADDGVMLTLPQVSYDQKDGFANAVEVIGGKPKGAKKKIRYRLVANHNHPMSPWNIGRNGTPRFIPMVIEDDSIKSKKAAKAVAKRNLKMALGQSVSVAFDSLPVPFLEEMDLVRFKTETGAGQFRIEQMSIPLTADGTSSIGYLKNVTPRKRRATRHRRRRNAGR